MLRIIIKIAAIAAIALSTNLSASAQQRKMAVGAYWGYGSGPSIGIGGKLQYGISDPIRLEASLASYWGARDLGLTKMITTVSDLSVNAHYIFSFTNKSTNKASNYLYPLVGVGRYKATAKVTGFGVDETVIVSKVGLNIGGGIETFFSSDRYSYFLEGKVAIGNDLNRFSLLMGLAYHF